MFDVFVGAIIQQFPAARDSAYASIQKQHAKIQSLINRRYTEDEADIEKAELALAGQCVEAVGHALTKTNRPAITKAGFEAIINSDNETLAPALQSRMQHNLLRLSGVKGGDVTGRPPAPPPGETRESAQVKIDAADPRTASPEPPKRGPGRPPGSGNKPKEVKPAKKTQKGKKGKKVDDDDFAAGVEGEAAKSEDED
jgi:hypothetical protein